MKKVVISGAPCSGKTSLINELKSRGFRVVEESALYVIKKEVEKDNGILPWTRFEEFEKLVIKVQKKLEEQIPKETKVVFLDRSFVDIISYIRSRKMPLPLEAVKYVKEAKYNKVILLDILPKKYWGKTHNGKKRKTDSYGDALKLQKVIRKAYEEYNIPIESLRVMPTDKRADVVLKMIRS